MAKHVVVVGQLTLRSVRIGDDWLVHVTPPSVVARMRLLSPTAKQTAVVGQLIACKSGAFGCGGCGDWVAQPLPPTLVVAMIP
jgi:hypothetical protein